MKIQKPSLKAIILISMGITFLFALMSFASFSMPTDAASLGARIADDQVDWAKLDAERRELENQLHDIEKDGADARAKLQTIVAGFQPERK